MRILFIIFILPVFVFAEDPPDKNRELRDKLVDIYGAQHAHTSSLNEKRAKEERAWVKKFQAIAENLETLEKRRSEKLVTYHDELRALQLSFDRQLKASDRTKQNILDNFEKELALKKEEIEKQNLLDIKKLDLAEYQLQRAQLTSQYIQDGRKLTDKHQDEMKQIDQEFIDNLAKASNLSRDFQLSSLEVLNKIQQERLDKETNLAKQLANVLGVVEGKTLRYGDYAREPEDPPVRTGPRYRQIGSNSPLNFDFNRGGRRVIYQVRLEGKVVLPNEHTRIYDAIEKIYKLQFDPAITLEIADKKPLLKFEGKAFRLEFLDQNKEVDAEIDYYLQRRFLADLIDTWGVENLIELNGQRVTFTVPNLKPEKEARVFSFVRAIQKGRLDLIKEYQTKYDLSYTKDFNLKDKEGEYKVQWSLKDDDFERRWKAQIQKIFNPPKIPREVVDNLEVAFVKEKEPLNPLNSKALQKAGCDGYRLTVENKSLRVDRYDGDGWVPLFRVERFLEDNQVSCSNKFSIAVVGTSLIKLGDLRFDLNKKGTFTADVIEDAKSLTIREKDKTTLFIVKDKTVVRALTPFRGQFESVDFITLRDSSDGEFRAMPGVRDDKGNTTHWNFEGTIYVSPDGKVVRAH